MAMKRGDLFEGYLIEGELLHDDGVARYEARQKGGLTKALVHLPTGEFTAKDIDAVDAVALGLVGLSDPLLPEILEARLTNGVPWVAYSYPPKGERLSAALSTGEKCVGSVAEALALIDSVADVLERASRRGVVHGRLQPGVIWVDNRSRLVSVYDVGLAAIFGPMPLECPRRYCLAPEVIMGQPASVQGDIYALTVVLYEMLSGHPLFTSENSFPAQKEMIDLILKADPLPLSKIREGLPWPIDTFVANGLAKLPGSRFATWHEYRRDLSVIVTNYLRDPAGIEAPKTSIRSMGTRKDLRVSPLVEIPAPHPSVVPAPVAPLAELPASSHESRPPPLEVPPPTGPRIPEPHKEPLAMVAALAVAALVGTTIAASYIGSLRAAEPTGIGSRDPSATVASATGGGWAGRAVEKARARALVLQATDAVLAGDSDKAEGLLRSAWRLERTFDISGNLGKVELANGKPREAAEHLRFSLRTFPPSESSAVRARVQSEFDAARARVAAISIRVSVDGADVSIDGESVGISPLADEVYVMPGHRVVTATLDGYDGPPVVVVSEPGRSHMAEVILGPAPLRSPLLASPSARRALASLAASEPASVEEPPREVEEPPREVEEPPREVEEPPREVEEAKVAPPVQRRAPAASKLRPPSAAPLRASEPHRGPDEPGELPPRVVELQELYQYAPRR